MSGHILLMLPGSERRLTLIEIEQFALTPFTRGQTTLEAEPGWIDVSRVSKSSFGSWMIWGWFTARKEGLKR